MEEIELEGGRSTRGVTRSGDILYRPHKPQSDFANSFLKFLEERNCPFSQRYIGRDKCGRDMFRFIEGYVPKEIGDTTLPQLRTFMRIMRILHDHSADFAPNGKVVRRNDLSPCNTVFENGKPIAVIDWDGAKFGERWEDITYAVWLRINIGSHNRVSSNIITQLKAALSAYRADRDTLCDFSEKLIWRMNKVVADMSPDNYQYERTKEWVDYSKIWVENNRKFISEVTE